MNGKGRKLFRSAVGILTSVMMMGAYTTTAMASGIGVIDAKDMLDIHAEACLLYTSPSPRDRTRSRMPSSA